MPAEGTLLQLTIGRDGAVRIQVHAKPRSRRSRIAGTREGALAVELAAPPVDGAANEELVATLAGALGVPKRDVSVALGASSRAKLVEVRGLTEGQVRERLEKELARR
jgi:uncharacterized protein (TIGR00251 family)